MGAREESDALLDLAGGASESVESVGFMPEVRATGEKPASSSNATSLKSESVATESLVDKRKDWCSGSGPGESKESRGMGVAGDAIQIHAKRAYVTGGEDGDEHCHIVALICTMMRYLFVHDNIANVHLLL